MQKTVRQNQQWQAMQDNSSKERKVGEVKKKDFYNHYLKHKQEREVDKSVYNKFLKVLLDKFSTAIVETGLELKLTGIGKLRVRSKKLNYFTKEGKRAKSVRPNWKATLEYWKVKYPDQTLKELKGVPNKPILYHENDHTSGEFYEHHWDNNTTSLKYKSFYGFKASRQYSRLIAKIVKDPNRKTFYYG